MDFALKFSSHTAMEIASLLGVEEMPDIKRCQGEFHATITQKDTLSP